VQGDEKQTNKGKTAMLKITRAIDPIHVTTVTLCGYALPGIGKTSLGYTADKPLLLDFDKGSYRSKFRQDTVQIENWTDVTAITAEDLAPFRTVVIDTAGRALDVLSAHIMKNNPKASNKLGGLSLQGYGELKSVFTSWLKFVRSFGLDVVLLSHSDEQKDGDEVKERLDIQGGSKNEICKAADSMARLYLHNGKRMLNFSPTDTAFGKNPASLPPLEVPNFGEVPNFLATVITRTKAALNELNAEQTAVAALLAEWQDKLDKAATIDELNALLPSAKEADERVRDNLRRMMTKAGKDRGAVVDKAKGIFVMPPAAAVAPAQPETPAAAAPEPAKAEPAADQPAAAAAAQPEREPGDEPDEDEANRKAAEPTADEAAQMELGKAEPAVPAKKAPKGKAAA
jgi:hypothetical protein